MGLLQIGTETSVCTPFHLTILYPVGLILSGPGSQPFYVSFQLLSSRRTWISLLAPFLSFSIPCGVFPPAFVYLCFVTISGSFLARGPCNPYHLYFSVFQGPYTGSLPVLVFIWMLKH